MITCENAPPTIATVVDEKPRPGRRGRRRYPPSCDGRVADRAIRSCIATCRRAPTAGRPQRACHRGIVRAPFCSS
ncbi:hypothetical protein quinque_007493 [Culex quinquefasciatus]